VVQSPTSSTCGFLCRLGLAWNSLVTRLSSSFELEAKMKVRPLMFVSTTPDGAVAELLFTLYMLGTARCWRRMNVKLNVSSSSLGNRMRKDGGPSPEADSGSCKECLALLGQVWGVETHLDVLDHTLVPELAPCDVSCCGEGIRRDVQQRAIAVVGDVQRRNRDCSWLAMRPGMCCTREGIAHIASGRGERARPHPRRRLCC
jgi:hypothetical protein